MTASNQSVAQVAKVEGLVCWKMATVLERQKDSLKLEGLDFRYCQGIQPQGCRY